MKKKLEIKGYGIWTLEYVTIDMTQVGHIQWHLRLFKNGHEVHAEIPLSDAAAKAAVANGQTEFAEWNQLENRAELLALPRWG